MSTILVSVITSSVVALGIEWLAKPRLEARKEKILERYRALVQVGRLLASIMTMASKLSNSSFPSGLNELSRRALREEYERTNENIVSAIRSLEEATLAVALFMNGRIHAVLISYVGYSLGVALSDATWMDKGTKLVECTYPLLNVLGHPNQGWLYKLRLFHRGNALREAEAQFLREDEGTQERS